jgi:hypothetical protein
MQVCAVECEFGGLYQDDECRMAAALAATAQPEHPLNTFSWGASRGVWKAPQEQSIAVRDIVLRHLELYSASLMNLVVLGGESLDVLEEYVTEYFGPVCIFTAFAVPTLCISPHYVLHSVLHEEEYNSYNMLMHYQGFRLPVAAFVLPVSVLHGRDFDCMISSMMQVDG